MDEVKNKTARSLLYFFIAGGLLFFASAFTQWFINTGICPHLNIQPFSLLECIGFVAIIGVILFAVKYGFFNNIDISFDALQNYAEEQKDELFDKRRFDPAEKLRNLDSKQQKELKEAISKYLGIDEPIRVSENSNFNPPFVGKKSNINPKKFSSGS